MVPKLVHEFKRFSSSHCEQKHSGPIRQTGQVGTHLNILCNSAVKCSPALTMEFPIPIVTVQVLCSGLRLGSQDSVKCCQCFYGWCPVSEPGACEQTVSRLKWTGQFSGKHGLSIGLLFTAGSGKIRIMDLVPVKCILGTEQCCILNVGEHFWRNKCYLLKTWYLWQNILFFCRFTMVESICSNNTNQNQVNPEDTL